MMHEGSLTQPPLPSRPSRTHVFHHCPNLTSIANQRQCPPSLARVVASTTTGSPGRQQIAPVRRNYACDDCGRTFTRRIDLRKHVPRKHYYQRRNSHPQCCRCSDRRDAPYRGPPERPCC
ncbi:hypothetical protein C8Q73DRAFT_313546 [Cubamyces lactineus]|nr:hypothetical protein C8Q73DRAFT_313546 [Cubamyces lactineus]